VRRFIQQKEGVKGRLKLTGMRQAHHAQSLLAHYRYRLSSTAETKENDIRDRGRAHAPQLPQVPHTPCFLHPVHYGVLMTTAVVDAADACISLYGTCFATTPVQIGTLPEQHIIQTFLLAPGRFCVNDTPVEIWCLLRSINFTGFLR
jgi:hypothetical protein